MIDFRAKLRSGATIWGKPVTLCKLTNGSKVHIMDSKGQTVCGRDGQAVQVDQTELVTCQKCICNAKPLVEIIEAEKPTPDTPEEARNDAGFELMAEDREEDWNS